MDKKYQISESKLKEIESSDIAYAVYQMIDKRVVTLALSGGFVEMCGVSRDKLLYIMDNDMFGSTHPDDLARVQNDSYYFASHTDSKYSTSYRVKFQKQDYYVILRAQGIHKKMEDGSDVCVIWYTKSTLPAEEIALRNHEEERREIEELRKENNSIRRMNYDILTGLPNMTLFMQIAGAALRNMEDDNSLHTVMAFDLTGMKHFNSKFGLEEGDRLLCAFADILRKHFGNECCSRFGEDHFYAFTEDEYVEADLYNIFTELKDANEGRSLPVKVGIYKHDDEEIPISTICDRAKMAADFDKKTYASKFVYFDESMEKATEKREYVLHHLNQALEERWIQVYYQPIVRSVTGCICDEEALARWVDPNVGMISPEDFIPIIEEAKLLYKLDLYMVERILDDMKRYKIDDTSLLVPVSVNISRYDFEYCDMVTEITRRVKDADISTRYLVIEITESVMGMDPEFLKEQVSRFHKNGFKVWMDDFGSGYSSLNVLQDFDFDLIKLDMKFMMDFGKSKKNKGIIIKIIEMAEQLGVDTLAEGVETEEQVEFLKEIGCDKMQGYLYSAPNPLQEILKRHKLGVGLKRENMEESDYYDKIGQASLDDPDVNGDTGMQIARHFTGIGVGIMEYNGNDEYRILRVNKSYRNYIKIMYGESIKIEGAIHYSDRARHGVFKDSVHRCIASGNWEAAYDIVSVSDIKINTNTRVLARDPITGAYALLIVITSEKRDKRDKKGYEIIRKDSSDNIGTNENDNKTGYIHVESGEDGRINQIEADQERDNAIRRRQAVDDAIVRIIGHLNTINKYDASINLVLKEIGAAIHPDRIYILERDNKRISNSYELCADGIDYDEDSWKKKNYDIYCQTWENYIEANGIGISFEVSELKSEYKELYFGLRNHGVKRIAMVPVFSQGMVIGFVGADNYRLNEKDETEHILSAVAGFLSFRMANNILVEKLTYVAEHDALTSAYNRNAMLKRETEMASSQGSVGVVYADLNGLKYTNDNFGHDEGDRLLVRAADFIAQHYGIECLYRIGGDEFIAIIPNIDKASFDRKRYSFLQDLDALNNLSMATGFVWSNDVKNISEVLKEADRRMYADKAEYYSHHDRRHEHGA